MRVRGTVATKAATQVEEADPIVVAEGEAADGYVSRGAHKLIGALDAFPAWSWRGGTASTPARPQEASPRCCWSAARHACSPSMSGTGSWPGRVRTDPRVSVIERTNVRSLAPTDVPWRPELVVADLSFIPLELVLPALAGVSTDDADLVLMVKPQFEVGRAAVGDGVVRDPGPAAIGGAGGGRRGDRAGARRARRRREPAARPER